MKNQHALGLFTKLCTAMVSACLSAGTASAHSAKPHSAPTSAVKKEQKDWGIAGDAKAVQRTVQFSMSDTMRFTPNRLQVKQGETLRLVVKNRGKVMHEFVLGTPKELEEDRKSTRLNSSHVD